MARESACNAWNFHIIISPNTICSDRGCKVGWNYYYPECRSPFFIPRRGRVHNSCKRLSSARAAQSPAFHAGVTCKSLHRNWGTCRHGRQKGTSQADEEKEPVLIEAKQSRPRQNEMVLFRAFPLISRGSFLGLFFCIKRSTLQFYVCEKRKHCAALVCDYPYIHYV